MIAGEEDPVLPWYNDDLEVLPFCCFCIILLKLERLIGFLKMPVMKPERVRSLYSSDYLHSCD